MGVHYGCKESKMEENNHDDEEEGGGHTLAGCLFALLAVRVQDSENRVNRFGGGRIYTLTSPQSNI